MSVLLSRPTCNTCKKPRALKDFHKKTKAPTGHSPVCRDCTSSRRKTYRVGLGDELEVPRDKQLQTYRAVIAKMYANGIASKEFCKEALDRIEK